MSYHVQLFQRATQTRFEAANDPAFFEDEKNLVAFTAANRERLVSRLELVGFVAGTQDERGRRFVNEEWGAEAVLTDAGLYLSGSGEDAVFEISMFASESVDNDVVKFDPQDGTWE
ncbi:MAG: hypothetical protein M3680_12840 [Myxococcota bacterium]|nr:hypothetical protein [Myxococcota bacterium]